VGTTPFREVLRGLQMLALYGSSRGKQALQTYQRARRTLMEEVGTEPGAELQELHRRILDDDAALLVGTVRPGCAGRRNAAADRRGAPARRADTADRTDDVRRELAALVGEHRLVTVVGAAGCGKTRVAVEVARTVKASFPDGVWFVDLTAVSDPELAVDVVVSTIGFAARAAATPLEDLRNYLRARRVLLVLRRGWRSTSRSSPARWTSAWCSTGCRCRSSWLRPGRGLLPRRDRRAGVRGPGG